MLIYGGSAYSYAHDPDFFSVGYSERQWQKVIDEYYTKYKGLKKWHDELLIIAMKQGFIEIPSGRYYFFRPNERGQWPLTTIKNYPVQGFGADFVRYYSRIKAAEQARMDAAEDQLEFQRREYFGRI